MNQDCQGKNPIDKGGYPHFMLKEINEQPQVLQETLARGILSTKNGQLAGEYSRLELSRYERVVVLACGTAYHAGLVGKCFIEKVARIPVTVELASEFRYTDPFVDSNTLVIAISQSGETGDTLAALGEAKTKGGRILAITNVEGSTVSREAHHVLYTVAGKEVSIASTKAYMAQLGTLYLLGLQLALVKRRINFSQLLYYLEALKKLPLQLEETLQEDGAIKPLAVKLAHRDHAFFLGRGMDTPIAMEGALKLKETSYIHAEAYPAGEFRHGPVALIETGSPAVILATQPELAHENIAVMEDLKNRDAWVIGISMNDMKGPLGPEDDHIVLPITLPELAPMLAVVPLQLLAYYTACGKGTDVDTPRNLVKSVQDIKPCENICIA